MRSAGARHRTPRDERLVRSRFSQEVLAHPEELLPDAVDRRKAVERGGRLDATPRPLPRPLMRTFRASGPVAVAAVTEGETDVIEEEGCVATLADGGW